MSMVDFDPVIHGPTTRKRSDHIVPERIREACVVRGLSLREAARLCKIDKNEFGKMANGRMKIPEEIIFNLMLGLSFPKEFFYFYQWKRC